MKPSFRILYTEDNAQDAELTLAHFAEFAPELDIDVVRSGQACIDQLQAEWFDLLMLDYRLPDMDGLAVLKWLIRAGITIPVVLVTGGGDEELVMKSLSLGVANYVSKNNHDYLAELPGLLHSVLKDHRHKQGLGLTVTSEVRKILYIEHLAMDIDLTLSHFAEAVPHFIVDVSQTCSEGLECLSQSHDYDLVLIDQRMPVQSGFDLVREAQSLGIKLPPFLIISGESNDTVAMAAMKLGAADYLCKNPGYLDKLPYRIDRAINQHRLKNLVEQLQSELTVRKQIEAQMVTHQLTLEAQTKELRVAAVAFEAQQPMLITNADQLILQINHAYTEMTGYTVEYLLGQHARILKSGRQEKNSYLQMWASIKQTNTWSGEICNKRKNGELYPAYLTITAVIDVNGIITHYVAVISDITEQKQHQSNLLLAKEDAEKLAKIKAQFIASMSHEIRTPMSAIMGLSQLAFDKTLPAKTQTYLTNINKAATSLLGVLNDILDFSKLEAGRIVIEQQSFQLEALLDTLYSLFVDAAKVQGLNFSIEHDSNIPTNLIGDKLRLQQVLTNLLGNAIKFTDQGSVGLEITLQQIDLKQVRLLFCVTDTGIGLSSEDQQQLFQPFSQVDGSITRRFGGTGLGLAISHDLLQLMGGKFLLNSSPGVGSQFSFELVLGLATSTFQYQVTNSPKTPDLIVAVQDLNDFRILLVEDNLFIQEIVLGFLAPSGISIEIANSGEEALLMLEQGEFDGVLMDIHMPVMNGFEATERIRSLPKFAHLPVIALTAAVTVEEQKQCITSGMNDFIPKPIDPKQLVSTLVRWLKSNGNPQALLQYATELDLLLEANDYISEDLLSSLKTHLATDQHDIFICLQKSYNELDYDQARKVLRQLVTLPQI